MNNITVSYLVALYNKEKYIVECIDSILQEANDEITIEVCIVNDGSSDASLDIVMRRYENNSSVILYSFNKNKGKNAAYNKAFLMSSGQYICIFGADDIVVPGRTQRLLKESRLNGLSIYGNYKVFYDEDSLLRAGNTSSLPCAPNFYENIMANQLPGGVGIFLRSHLNNVFPIPENLRFEDWWISYMLLKNKLAMVSSEVVSYYRIHGANDCGSAGSIYDAARLDYMRHFDYIKEFIAIATTKKEIFMLNKSLALRESFVGTFRLRHLRYIAFDKYSLKIIFFNIFGSRVFYGLWGLVSKFKLHK